MVLLLAVIFLALGVSMAVAWHLAFLQVLQGLAPLFFLFLGTIFLVVGYSERKARRKYDKAIYDEGTRDDSAGEEPRRRR